MNNNNNIRVRYGFAISKTKLSKKGKRTTHTGGAFLEINTGRGWVKVSDIHAKAEEDGDTATAERLAPFCASIISKYEIKRTRLALCKVMGAEITDEMKASAREEEKTEKERNAKREERERAIIADGRETFTEKGADAYGARFDRLVEKYSAED